MTARTIWFYTDAAAFGGAERLLLTLVAGLDRGRWHPVLAYHPAPGIELLSAEAEAAGAQLRPLQPLPDGLRGAVRAAAVARVLRSSRPDVFHAQLTWQGAGKYGLFAAVAARVPAVVASYNLLVDAALTRPTILQQRALASGVGRAIVVSRELDAYLRDRFHWRPEKIRLIHSAVTVAEPPPCDPALRAELSPDGKPVVLTLARLDPLKGHRYLLDAAVALPEARFVFAGEGPERAALERRADALGVASRVRFLGHRRDGPALLACADVFALASLAEGLPVAILEAMAARRPVVATRVGDVDAAVVDGQTGILVEPRDAGGLANAVRRLLADTQLAAGLGAAAAERVRRTFGAAEMVERTAAVYDELLENRDGRR